MSSKSYSTNDAAKAVGISRMTIQAWVKNGVVRPPKIHTRPGKPPARLWSATDINRLKVLKRKMRAKVGRPPRKRKNSKV